jgi:hypothetical protein
MMSALAADASSSGEGLAIVLLAIYFAPAILATVRRHPKGAGITILNLFLGWTLVGWVLALVWAVTGPQTVARSAAYRQPAASDSDRKPCPYCAELIMPQARVCPFCRSELTRENVAAAMQSAYDRAKGRTDDVRPRPTIAGGWSSEPAWLTRFRALDPGKQFAVALGIGALVIVGTLMCLMWFFTPAPGQRDRSAQSSISRAAGQDLIARTARENPSTVINEATNSPTAAPPRSSERTPGSTIVDPSKIPPPWLVLRQGVRAFTGDDGGGASALTICPSVRLYKRWFSDATAVVPECQEIPRGIPVTIGSDEIVSSGLIGEYFVFIRADKASWSGWTGSLGLHAYIPANTRAVVNTPSPQGSVSLFPDRTAAGGEIVLRGGATLQILSQDTKSGDRPDLYVEITGNSPDAGKKGWIHSLGLNVQGGGPLLFTTPSGAEWR